MSGLAQVSSMASELAARVRYAQIVGHPIPAEQLTALVAAARLMQDRGEPWPHVVAEVLNEVAESLDGEIAQGTPEPESQRDGVVVSLSRFLGAFRREKRSPPGPLAN